MRQTIIMVSVGAVVAALAAIAGSTIVGNAPKQHAASAAGWVGVMDLMKGQKNLPEEAFDAY
jgi:sugar phosphate permease